MKRHLAILLTLCLTAALLSFAPTRAPRVIPTAMSAPNSSWVLWIRGDSITAGYGIAAPWRDDFVARTSDLLCGYGCPQVHSVGYPGQCLVATGCAGGTLPTMISTFTAEILDANPKPTEVLLEAGLNDDMNVSEFWFENAYSTVAALCAAAGVRFIASTITPIAAFRGYYNPWRVDVNNWIRATYGPSGNMVDFDAVLQGGTGWLDPAYDSGDGIHPNPLGALRMADITEGLNL